MVAHGRQIDGGTGFTTDGTIPLFFRRQTKGELLWGDGDYHASDSGGQRALRAGV